MDLGLLVCKGCGRAVGKLRDEEPTLPGLPRRSCTRCTLRVTLDPDIPLGVPP